MDAFLQERVLSAALQFIAAGVSCIPMSPWDKRPKQKWLEYQSRLPTAEEVSTWSQCNLAIVTGSISRIVVADFETKEDAHWFWNRRGKTDLIVRTRRGYHLYFQHPGERVANAQRVPDEQGHPRYDVRGDGGYVIAPPSYYKGHQYHFVGGWIDPESLPVFKMAWRPEIRKNGQINGAAILNGVQYIAKIVAISGSGGHNATWRAVNKLRESGLDETEATAAMMEWNQSQAKPPWSTTEILHKVKDCYSIRVRERRWPDVNTG